MYNRPERDYYSAAICRRGHVETMRIELNSQKIKAHCEKCGAPILTSCPNCEKAIQGAPTGLMGNYPKPDFCTYCASPFPWVSRQARLYQLENLLDGQEGLSEADRLTIQEQIQALTKSDMADEEQVKRWKMIRKVSPTLFEFGKELIFSVTSDLVQKQIGIK